MSAKDLVEFLDSSDANTSKIALENILQFTPAAAGHTSLFCENDYKGLRAIKKLSVQSADPQVIHNSLIALINLSDSEAVRAELVADKLAIQKYAKYIASSPKLSFVQYACMLLTNLGREADTLTALKGPLLAALILTTAKPANISDEDFDFLAFALGEFARQDSNALAKSLPFLYQQLVLRRPPAANPSLNRRTGVSAVLKNALFNADLHEPLANDTPLIETIMICLKGPETMDAEDYEQLPPMVKREHSEGKVKQEEDESVQYTLMECLLLLSSSQAGREALRAKYTYFVVRELHQATSNPELAEICEKFVNMVMRGDPDQQKYQQSKVEDVEDDEEDRITEVV